MTIQDSTLRSMLNRMQPWSWRWTDWRRVGDKILRFVDWRKAVRA